MITYVIKYHELYYSKYPSASFTKDIFYATKFAHPDIAIQEMTASKLNDGCKVYQISIVELEMK